MLQKTETTSIQEVAVFAKALLEHIKKEVLDGVHKDTKVVLLLSGPLGSGKTALVKEIGGLLGVSETITSATFVLHKEYITTDETFQYLTHIDLYRLEDEKEIETLGWEAVMTKTKNLTIIEWPERAPKYIPKNAYGVTISVNGATHTFTPTP